MKRVTLYGSAECHLCAVAKEKIERVRRIVPLDVEIVDVRRDPDLLARYGTTIPVVAIDGHVRLVSKVTEFGLLKALLRSSPYEP
jgi:hypothetical protein